jgi:hypothetical protein
LQKLADFPFYRARIDSAGAPQPWTLADLEEFAAQNRNDPFAGRVIGDSVPKVALQLEATNEPPVWSALDVGEVDRWAQVVARMWQQWGLAPGETIAFFDYGSSPMVLLASSSYMAYLRRGAADRLGVTAICNDGVATMAPRMAAIVETVRPSALILRRDLLAPFASALDTASVKLARCVRWIAVSEPEGAPTPEEVARYAGVFGVPTYRVLRADAAFLLAGECPDCGCFHLDRAYEAEPLSSNELAVTTTFAQLCPAVRYNIGSAEIAGGRCAREPRTSRIACT